MSRAEATSDKLNPPLGYELRLLQPDDDVCQLTELLHEAYAALAELGLRYLATHQDAATTLKRASHGECWLLLKKQRMVGTFTLELTSRKHGPQWYRRADVAVIQQFGIKPALQRKGLGSFLLNFAELRALQSGCTELAMDTSEKAEHLLQYYKKRGYRTVSHTDWDITNYRSVILTKKLV